VIVFTHAHQSNHIDEPPPAPLTWDYAKRLRYSDGRWACRSGDDLAECTCHFGHTTRLSGAIHAVAADGTVTPSYVCPVGGCTFHEWVRLDGWDPGHVFEVVDVEG
jgi:hypothetical protein